MDLRLLSALSGHSGSALDGTFHQIDERGAADLLSAEQVTNDQRRASAFDHAAVIGGGKTNRAGGAGLGVGGRFEGGSGNVEALANIGGLDGLHEMVAQGASRLLVGGILGVLAADHLQQTSLLLVGLDLGLQGLDVAFVLGELLDVFRLGGVHLLGKLFRLFHQGGELFFLIHGLILRFQIFEVFTQSFRFRVARLLILRLAAVVVGLVLPVVGFVCIV